MMNSKAFSFCTDIGYLSVNKHDEQLCGDHVELVEQDENSIVFVRGGRTWKRCESVDTLDTHLQDNFHDDGEQYER